jgi:arylamine N-acetyltransferase
VNAGAGQPGSPAGNHLGLLVTLGPQQWLVDAGLGDGPRRPILLTPGPVEQGPFKYELIEEPGRWILVHDERGTFAEVVFAKSPVGMEEFRAPATEQATSEDSGFGHTLATMKRRKDEAHLLRGRVYEVIGEQNPPPRIVSSREEWVELLTTQFGLYLGNVSEVRQDDLWDKVCADHERWLREQGHGSPGGTGDHVDRSGDDDGEKRERLLAGGPAAVG